MKTLTRLALMILMTLQMAACANRVREADLPVSNETISAQMNSLVGASSNTTTDAVKELWNNGHEVQAYYSEAPSTLGRVDGILALDTSIIDKSLQLSQVQNVRIYFIEGKTAQGPRTALVIEYKKAGDANWSAKAFVSDVGQGGAVADKTYSVNLKADDGTQISLQSFDLDKSETDLANVIQMEVYSQAGGEQIYSGKISTLIQFVSE